MVVDARRYARLLALQLETSALTALQYRVDFLVETLLEVLWAAAAIAPLFVVFDGRPSVAGWSFGGALLVMGWFTVGEAVIEIAVMPGISTMSDHVQKGTLDFVLLKPADAQFLVTTSRFELPQAVNLLTGLGVITLALIRLGHWPTPAEIGAAGLLFVSAMMVVYAFAVLVASASFYLVRADNLNFLFKSVFSAARWPITVFRGPLRFVFTFVVPLGLMTTYPAQALLGDIRPLTLVCSVGAAVASVAVSRALWMRALRRYSSAS